MAQLPPDGGILVQLMDDEIVIFERYTEFEYHRFSATDANAIAIAQGRIHHDDRLSEEQRCFANFWSGYFYGYATGHQAPLAGAVNDEVVSAASVRDLADLEKLREAVREATDGE